LIALIINVRVLVARGDAGQVNIDLRKDQIVRD